VRKAICCTACIKIHEYSSHHKKWGLAAVSINLARINNTFMIAIVRLLVIAFLLACGSSSPAHAQTTPPPGRPAPQVVAAPVRLHSFSERLEALGTARANESVTVTSKVSEKISRIDFTDGALVQEGAVLAELTSVEESAQLAEAYAALRDARQQYDRVVPLVQNGSLSKARLDGQQAVLDGARARVAAIEARLSDRLIKAPFAGIVGLRRISPGTLVQPGDAIVTLDDSNPIKLDFTVPETQLALLAPGQTVTARSAAFSQQAFAGRVVTLDTRVDPVTRAVTVRALIDNPDHHLRPGMLMTVTVTGQERQSLGIPEEALIPEGQQQFVYIINQDNTVARRQVQIGTREPGVVEIRKGLKAGERVVTEGTMKVRPGQAVRVMPAAATATATGG
jgi:membrane fusion protein, multidrug efflux system